MSDSQLKEVGVRQVYKFCVDCNRCVRIDDGSYCQHMLTTARTHNSESTMVIFRGPKGKISVPWEPDTPTPVGYTREEVRGARAVRRLEKELDAVDITRHRRFKENTTRLFEPQRQQRREDLKQIIRDGVSVVKEKDGSTRTIRVTQFGRDLARVALEKSESGYSEHYEPGNHRD